MVQVVVVAILEEVLVVGVVGVAFRGNLGCWRLLCLVFAVNEKNGTLFFLPSKNVHSFVSAASIRHRQDSDDGAVRVDGGVVFPSVFPSPLSSALPFTALLFFAVLSYPLAFANAAAQSLRSLSTHSITAHTRLVVVVVFASSFPLSGA